MSGTSALRMISGMLAGLAGTAAFAANHDPDDPRLAGMLSSIGSLIKDARPATLWVAGILVLVMFGIVFFARRKFRRRSFSGTAEDRTANRTVDRAPDKTPDKNMIESAAASDMASAAPVTVSDKPIMAASGPDYIDASLSDYAEFKLDDDLVPDEEAGRPVHDREAYGVTQPGAHSPNAEDDADVVTRAELLMSQGLTDQAIAVLLQHIREAETPMPMAWLTLFDVFTRTGRRAHYEALSSGFSTLFNAIAPSWKDLQSEAHKHLEDYPAVLDRVQRLWGLPTCRAFLESLLHDDRGGARQGFLLTAYRDILFLIEIIDLLETMALEDEVERVMGKKLVSSG